MFSHGYEYSQHFAGIEYYRWLMIDGVGLFFVLSGFLIGGILIRTIEQREFNTRALFNFWRRRWLRTLPAYFCVLTIFTGSYFIKHQSLPPFLWRYYFFVQNFAWQHPLFFYDAWSLSVEEWFYVLVPLILLVILKLKSDNRGKILLLIIAVILSVTACRVYLAFSLNIMNRPEDWGPLSKMVITRMDGIMYGVLGAWMAHYFPSNFFRYKNLLLIAGLAVLIFCNFMRGMLFHVTLYHIVSSLGVVALFPALTTLKNGRGPVYRVVTFISMISYSMYLTNHMVVQRGILPVVTRSLKLQADNPLHNAFCWLTFWTLTVLCSYMLYRLVERPFMKLRK
jgi:peptidoglycan/LPS O-acetylase OafA/YrhL